MSKKVVVIELDKDIVREVDNVFKEYLGIVPLDEFEQKLLERFNYSPLVVIDEEDSEIFQAFKKRKFTFYELKDGMVYKNIFLSITQ